MDNLIVDRLQSARRDLLDLGTRNRLISTPRSSSRSTRLEIADELSNEVFRQLFIDRKAMSFLPRPGGEDDESEDASPRLFQPEEDEEVDEIGTAVRHTDDKLQTHLKSESLQKKLLRLYYDAKTAHEEQGVNILYLATGFLKWYEAPSSDRERFAPLILIPVELDRTSARSRFKIRWDEQEIVTNLSLQEKLRLEFNVELPDVPEVEALSPSDYFARVEEAIATQPRWEVCPNDIVLWFFSFSKFLMFRDLRPECWPDDRAIEKHGLVSAVLGNGFGHDPPICGDDDNIDGILPPIDMVHVVDADSSQSVAVEEVRQGRNLVIQGPPGTGKSQTITNMIATAVTSGRKVLFVAEKMAALEVVKRRLDNIGLGDMCLELHSHNANKREVLGQLARTLSLGRPKPSNVQQLAEELTEYRDRLNRHAEILHTPLEPAAVTPFHVLGELVRLRAAGVKPAGFQLDEVANWTAANHRERGNLLSDIVLHLKRIGTPSENPWLGVGLDSPPLPGDLDRLLEAIQGLIGRIYRLITAIETLCRSLHLKVAETCADVSRYLVVARKIATAPPMDYEAFSHDVWESHRADITSSVVHGTTYAASRSQLETVVSTVAWQTDVAAARRDLSAYGRSLFRLFNRRYREAQATLRGILATVPPKPLSERLTILDTLIRGQNAARSLESPKLQQLAQSAFGRHWLGTESDWPALNAIANWETECRSEKLPSVYRKIIGKIADTSALGREIKAVEEELAPVLADLRQVFRQLEFSPAVRFGADALESVPLSSLRNLLTTWLQDIDSITAWIAYRLRRKKLDAEGMSELGLRIDQGEVVSEEILDQYHLAYFEGLMRDVYRRFPLLAEFDGISHEGVLSRFRELDLQRIAVARQEVADAHYRGLPTRAESGEVGTVLHEINKKRAHKPVRKLLEEAGHAVQAIKPVFMMSPISIAQFLTPGILEFDLLLIDEASQVRPVDALGAMARCRQIVVVGDAKQLPPTSFFQKIASDEDDPDEDGAFQVQDLESILGLCESRMPHNKRMLRWHYRSRHESLIAVSNHEFYDDRLFIVPAASNRTGSLGLQFRFVANGVFDRGKSATNRIEAAEVADAVMLHAIKFPDKSLGIGAFSVAQRDAIIDELELRRRERSDLESFFAFGSAEPFFVKNLENIQGDERDVIFISVGYAKDDAGFMAMNFGPVSRDGGERRLNVLATRAKERCVVFSSITADDIDLNRARTSGARALKTFLTYARSGYLDIGLATDRDFDSPFEKEVAKAVESCGFTVAKQVGVSGFFIDLPVVDPDTPGRYLLGIECDGAAYHSSRSARDRDRLRQDVLESRGWIIHRIWSSDWFHNSAEQLKKTLAAIENAKVEWAKRDAGSRQQGQPTEPTVLDRDEVMQVEDDATTGVHSVAYTESSFAIETNGLEIHQLDTSVLAGIVERIVRTEAPIHRSEVARRTTTLWGLTRTGSRIIRAVEKAIQFGLRKQTLAAEGKFLTVPGENSIPIRNRENVQSATLKKPDMLPPSELQLALKTIIELRCGASRSETIVEAARLFGFRSTSAQLKSVLDTAVDRLIDLEAVVERNAMLYVVALEDGQSAE
jgi:very-short-patch-repair endonuclease